MLEQPIAKTSVQRFLLLSLVPGLKSLNAVADQIGYTHNTEKFTSKSGNELNTYPK